MARIADIALVMKVKPYRESSAMLSIFTRQHGLMTVIQKGFRRKKNQQPLAPFSLVEIALVGRSNLMTVTSCDLVERIQLEADGLASGFYVLELLSRGLGEQQVEEPIFAATVATLRALAQLGDGPGSQLGVCLRNFERVLLDQLGYGLNFEFEQDGMTPITADCRYVYRHQEGFVAIAGETGISGRAILSMGERRYTDAETLVAAREVYAQAMSLVVGEEPIVSRTLLSAQRGSV